MFRVVKIYPETEIAEFGKGIFPVTRASETGRGSDGAGKRSVQGRPLVNTIRLHLLKYERY